MRGRVATGVALGLLLTSACGAERLLDPVAGPGEAGAGPPPVIVSAGGAVLTLEPYTVCWQHGNSAYCADGMPADPLPDLGTVDGPITVSFDRAGWTFAAFLSDPTDDCRIEMPAPVTPDGDRSWLLEPAGPADRYRVNLSGRGPEGDVHVAFQVEQRLAGALPQPVARADVFYPDDDGTPKMVEGLAVFIQHLMSTPTEAVGTLSITASDGRLTTYPIRTNNESCRPQGFVALRGPGPPEGQVVDTVGPPPYTMRFDVQLDGRSYVATASWPADIDEETTSLLLEFTPILS